MFACTTFGQQMDQAYCYSPGDHPASLASRFLKKLTNLNEISGKLAKVICFTSSRVEVLWQNGIYH